MKKRSEAGMPDLFSWTPPKVAVGYSEDVPGRGALDNRISRTISRAMKDAAERGVSRKMIAKGMSDFLGRPVSEDMLNKWASEASDQHRITLDAFIALIDATGALDLMDLVTSRFDHVAVPSKYSQFITLHIAREKQKEVDALVARLEAEVRGVR